MQARQLTAAGHLEIMQLFTRVILQAVAAVINIQSQYIESRGSPRRARTSHSAHTDPPKELCCPITLDLLQHPVRTIYGHVFERNTLTRWLDGDNGDTCPITRRPLTVADVTYASDVAEAVHLWTRQAKKREKRKRNRARKQGRKHLRRYGRVVY